MRETSSGTESSHQGTYVGGCGLATFEPYTYRLQLWRRHFSDLALVWMEVLGKQLYKWVVEAVAKDQVITIRV